ncbi:hypothetical protein [Desulfatiglans anilini]|uniref:hypothetical protein n=1 Tax=Desulfatiglans anilini TaxID=90728 RepID=UPI0003F88BA0|nr:hypothetical protein [Desulfatiglans anilini]
MATTLSPSGLKTTEYGDTDWLEHHNGNWERLNNTLLYLSALLDVDISGRADGDILAYHAGSGKWKPVVPGVPK